MLTHRSMVSSIAGVVAVVGGLTASDVYISYLPLAHIFERETAAGLLASGATIGFYQVLFHPIEFSILTNSILQ